MNLNIVVFVLKLSTLPTELIADSSHNLLHGRTANTTRKGQQKGTKKKARTLRRRVRYILHACSLALYRFALFGSLLLSTAGVLILQRISKATSFTTAENAEGQPGATKLFLRGPLFSQCLLCGGRRAAAPLFPSEPSNPSCSSP